MRKGYIEATDKVRRFYADVSVTQINGGFGVSLDGKTLRTPKGAPLVLPSRGLAERVAEDWSRQGEVLDQAGMHATRLANTAVEAVAVAREAVAQSFADYAGSDVLCYYADSPAALVARQHGLWSPLLDRADRELGLTFVRVEGVIHRPQPPQTLARVRELAAASDDITLAGLAFGMSLFGSAVLSLGLQRGWMNGEEAFDLSRLDEAWQEEQWGVDEEAAERTARLREEAIFLERWFKAAAQA
ncbi:ATP12 family chaperone protein [Phenylobacterium immobile]|uniref:ATP12 family chaperone protein n=1 Tax=Phenylobacterium immobile TaxID=21 RepID=UPI000B0E834D|nr:ATP12 family protein [Phenylobacterium immobile]